MPKTSKNSTAKAKTALQGPQASAEVTKGVNMAQSTPTASEPTAEAKPKRNTGGKKGRSGAPVGNTNAIRHGLVAGMLPPNCRYIENRLNRFRRLLEAQVIAVHGSVSLTHAAHIQTSLRHERHSMLCQRWLRLEEQNLKASDKIAFSRELAKASTERDKALKELNLDKPPKAPWELDVEVVDDD